MPKEFPGRFIFIILIAVSAAVKRAFLMILVVDLQHMFLRHLVLQKVRVKLAIFASRTARGTAALPPYPLPRRQPPGGIAQTRDFWSSADDRDRPTSARQSVRGKGDT
jgi:hypothetical protein